MIKTICYISNISLFITEEDIEKLSSDMYKKNKKYNITGILIIQNGHFFQIMEGKSDVIDTVFENIKKDTRHTGLIKLIDTAIDIKFFGDYETGNFGIINSYAKLKKLRTYFEWIEKADLVTANKLIALTTNFLNKNK